MDEQQSTIVAEAIMRRLVALEEEIVDALRTTIHSGQYLQGQQVAALEKQLAERWGSKLAVATSSGTTALQLALTAAGIKTGDEVIVPALTFASTSFAVNAVGATPVFVDVDLLTLTMDPMAARRAITDKTKAIIPVHLYGQTASMHWLGEIAKEFNLKLIEDCAQAHGAMYGDKYAGTMGDFGCFSFWVGKIVGGLEDAGMVLGRHHGDWNTLLKLRDIGRLPGERYMHHSWGLRGRMGEFSARVIQIEMEHFDDWISKRRAVADLYNKGLSDLKLQLPYPTEGRSHVYYKYTLVASSEGQRAAIERHLQKGNIQPERIYPDLVPDQPAYQKGDLPYRIAQIPVAKDLVSRLTCLPMYPELSEDEVARVVRAVRAGCAEWELLGDSTDKPDAAPARQTAPQPA